MRRSAKISAALMVLGVAGATHAGMVARSAQVYHITSVPGPDPPTESLVLNTSSPGSSFSTYNGRAGMTADFTGAGTVRLDGYGFNLIPGYNFEYTRGTIEVDVIGGTISPTISTVDQGYYFGGTITLTNLDAEQTWTLRFGPFTPITSGDLVFPAPSGSYELTWDTRVTYMAGTTHSGTVALDLNFVPEPTMFGAMLPLMVVRRRR
jgi:hypothetical protein